MSDNILNDSLDKNENIANKVMEINISNEMKNSFLSYAMSVIVARALPDVRDGLNQFIEEFYMVWKN